MFVKWVDDATTTGVNDDLIVLPYATDTLCLDQHVYDYISLAVPMQRLHPTCRTAVDNAQTDKPVYSTSPIPADTFTSSPWKGLEKLLIDQNH